MRGERLNFAFLNVGHFLDHLFMLIFATVAALRLTEEWGMSYAALIPYATPGFIAFGICALPAGWLADKWSREGMMVIFFVGIGASSIATALANTPFEIALGLLAIGAIYAAVVWAGRGCRAAERMVEAVAPSASRGAASVERAVFVRLFSIIMLTTAIGGIIFQGTTFTLPKIFDERLAELAGSATAIGGYAFLVFSIAAIAQLYVGYLLDRHSARTVFAYVAGLQAVFFAVMYQLTGVAALLVAIAFMLVVFGQIPINDVLVGRITKSEWRARMYGIRFILNFTVMASTLPVIAGIHANWGFGMLFVVMAIAAGATFAAVLMLPRTGAIRAQPSSV